MCDVSDRLEKIYTVAEVAKYLKLSKSKVYYMVQNCEIPYIKIGRNVRIRKADLKQFLDGNTGYRKDLASQYQ